MDPRSFPNYVDLLSTDADHLLERIEDRAAAAVQEHDYDAALELVVRLRHLSRRMNWARYEHAVLAELDFEASGDEYPIES